MQTSAITDLQFRRAVEAIDSGDVQLLRDLLTAHPALLSRRLEFPAHGYFKHPYLLWFVANNPIRTGLLPANIVEIARLLVDFVQQYAGNSMQEQLDNTLQLVATWRVVRNCGVQLELLDVLLAAGAKLCPVMAALTEGNMEAASFLLSRGSELPLTAAACLNDMENAIRLEPIATDLEKQAALTAAAYYVHLGMMTFLISKGVDPDTYPDPSSGFHSHATALHQAVSSGSLAAVKLLMKVADKTLTDQVYHGTQLDWARYAQANAAASQKELSAIIDYLL
jgi:peptide-methionine (S)-S-oxide reductase